MKRKIAFTALSAAIVFGSASAVLADHLTWQDIENARQHMKLEIQQAYHPDQAAETPPHHKHHVSHERTQGH
jgi:hypothetical protein